MLGITLGKMVEKDCLNCAFSLEIEAMRGVEKFKTETQCRLGGDKYVQDYYVKEIRGAC